MRVSTPTADEAASSALPYVLVNMAMTADGKIATANRRIASFGSKRDLAHLYALRATVDAVMCGARTASAEDIHLGPGPARYRRRRIEQGLAEFNMRILVSGHGRIAPASSIFTHRFSPILILTTELAGQKRLCQLDGPADEVVVCGRTRIDFRAALAWLRSARGVKRLLCEGGGELNAALFSQGLVDELHLTICPFVFGGAAAPTIADGPGPRRLADAARFRLVSHRRIGDELFCVFRKSRPGRRLCRARPTAHL
ncbi:MAG: dihydrofolate reductase family protein [Verrucomicrobiota bacterium]|nr:dihydrofolate reductase family protein [Verrucomicrobiota bacterium]